MITIYDSQTGKLLSGYPVEVTQYQFTLVDEQGEVIGVFSRDNLPKPSESEK